MSDLTDRIDHNLRSTPYRQDVDALLIDCKDEIIKLRAVVDAARAAAKFCLWCCDEFFDGMNIDGGEAQDKMEELGLIEQRPTPEDSEWYGESDFLYFPTDALRALDGEPCPTCGGDGEVFCSTEEFYLGGEETKPCPTCSRAGRKDGEPCPTCEGRGTPRELAGVAWTPQEIARMGLHNGDTCPECGGTGRKP